MISGVRQAAEVDARDHLQRRGRDHGARPQALTRDAVGLNSAACRARTCSCRTSPSCRRCAARTTARFIDSGGDSVRMCGLRPAFAAATRCGRHACEQQEGAAHVDAEHQVEPLHRRRRRGVRLIALALLTRMSMPPKRSTASATAACTLASSRMSHCIGQRLAAGRLDLGGGGVDRAGQLRMRLGGLRGDRDVGAVARGAHARSPGRCRAMRR